MTLPGTKTAGRGSEQHKQQLKAVFFDFDGVLVDSNHTKTEAFRQLFSSLPASQLSKILEYHRLHGGISRVEKIRYAFAEVIGRPLTQAELASWAKRYSKLVKDKVVKVPLINGAQECLTALAGRVSLFLISGTPEEELKEIVAARKMSGYFREVLGSPVKKPEHVRRLLATYALQPHEVVFVGDALTDHHAAEETGLPFIGIRGMVELPAGVPVLDDCRRLVATLAARWYWSVC